MGLKRLAAAVIVVLLPASAPAAQQGSMEGGPERMQALIQEVRELLDRAEEKRQADPWLIRDIRKVLAKYEFPWTRTVYASDFGTKRDAAPKPWRVVSGQFRVDGRGLRSVVPTAEELAQAGESDRQDAAQEEQAPQTRGDQARELLGTVLEGALGDGQRREKQEPETRQAPPEPVAARALLPKRTSNAFALRITFMARAPEAGAGRLTLGPYQGRDAEAGYRIVYRPEAGAGVAGLELIKRGPGGTEATVARYDEPVSLADGETHTLLWTRNRDGRMQVDLDGRQVLDVTDRGFSDPFAGLIVHNAGGDYAIDSLVIKDAG